MHKDLTPHAIYLQKNNKIKITNYYYAEQVKGARSKFTNKVFTEPEGTLGYLAPEIYRGSYDYKVDRWSVGCILHKLLTGRVPCESEDEEETKQLTLDYTFDRADLPEVVSDEACDFLSHLLQPDPQLRLGWSSLLSHPWLLQL